MYYADRSYTAKEIVKNPDMLSSVGGYTIIRDTGTCNNLVKALNSLDAQGGWRVVNMARSEEHSKENTVVLVYRD